MEEPDALFRLVAERIALSLHVSRLAVLTRGSGAFVPAYLYGYSSPPHASIAPDAGFVRQMEREQRPLRIYLDDPGSWINRSPQVSEEERNQLVELQAELLLPLQGRGRLLGFISLGRKLSEEPYSNLDLRLLQSVAQQTGLAMENLRLASEIAREISERDKLNREMEIAKEVQERLFPQGIIPVPELDYFGECRPALGVGGDYYDYFELPGKKLALAIGDVSGKGISAALMMASLQAALRGQALVLHDQPASIISNVNRLLHETSATNRYATLFYAEYDPAVRQLAYVNAGHNPPVLLRPRAQGFECVRLETGGVVVGLFPESEYEQGTINLKPGDLLVAYTDGISEAMNTSGMEWGEDTFIQSIQEFYGLPATEFLHQLIAVVGRFTHRAPQHDDMTLLVARLQGRPEGPSGA